MTRYIGPCLTTELMINSNRFSKEVLDFLVEKNPTVPVTDREGAVTVGYTVQFSKFGEDILNCEFVLTHESPNLLSGLKLMAYRIVPFVHIIKHHMEPGNITVIDEIILDHMYLTMFPADAKLSPLERWTQ